MVLTQDTVAAIQRAIIRATARNIQAELVDVTAVGYDRTHYYACGAFSHAGSHRVALHYTADGVTAVCDCEAGQQGRICQHVAAAMMAEEAPQVEPDDTLDDEIRSLSERLTRYWTTEYGSHAEYDALLAKLCDMRSRTQTPGLALPQPVPVVEPWKDGNFISDLMNPGAF